MIRTVGRNDIVLSALDVLFLQAGLWLYLFFFLLSGLSLQHHFLPALLFSSGFLYTAHQLGPLVSCYVLVRNGPLAPEWPNIRRGILQIVGGLVVFFSIIFFVLPYKYALLALVIFAIIQFVLNMWHIGLQNYGVLAIQRRLAGDRSEAVRIRDYRLCILVNQFLVPMAFLYGSSKMGDFTQYLSFVSEIPRDAFAFAILLIFLYWIARDLIERRLTFGRVSFVVYICLQPVSFLFFHPVLSYVLYSMGHFLVEVFFAARLSAQPRPERFRAKAFAKALLGLCVLGFVYAKIQVNPHVLGISMNKISDIIPTGNELYTPTFFFLFVLGMSVLFLHYYLSYVIYRHDGVKQVLTDPPRND